MQFIVFVIINDPGMWLCDGYKIGFIRLGMLQIMFKVQYLNMKNPACPVHFSTYCQIAIKRYEILYLNVFF